MKGGEKENELQRTKSTKKQIDVEESTEDQFKFC